MIDMITYISVFALLALALSIAYLVSWLQDQRSYSLAYWSAGLLLLAISSTIVVARLYLQIEISMVLGNSISIVAYFLILSGVRYFFGRSVPSLITCTVVFFISFFTLAVAFEVDYQFFNVLVVLILMILYSLMAYNLLVDRSQRSSSTKMTALACILTIFLLIFRLLDHLITKQINSIEVNSLVTEIALLVNFAVFALVYIGFLLMSLERSNSRLAMLANTDSLTNLRSRRDFFTTAEPAYARCRRAGESDGGDDRY